MFDVSFWLICSCRKRVAIAALKINDMAPNAATSDKSAKPNDRTSRMASITTRTEPTTVGYRQGNALDVILYQLQLHAVMWRLRILRTDPRFLAVVWQALLQRLRGLDAVGIALQVQTHRR